MSGIIIHGILRVYDELGQRCSVLGLSDNFFVATRNIFVGNLNAGQ